MFVHSPSPQWVNGCVWSKVISFSQILYCTYKVLERFGLLYAAFTPRTADLTDSDSVSVSPCPFYAHIWVSLYLSVLVTFTQIRRNPHVISILV